MLTNTDWSQVLQTFRAKGWKVTPPAPPAKKDQPRSPSQNRK